MITKNYLRSAILCASLGLFFSSCKKSGSSSPIVGTWNLYQEAEDDNDNGVADPSEITAVPSGETESITFNSNGSGTFTATVSGLTESEQFTWTLTNNNTTLMLTSQGSTSSAIVSISGSKLIVEDATDVPIEWDYFNKQ